MNHLKSLRLHLGLTQQALSEVLGCTQGNVGHYERGQSLPPDTAAKLIAYAGGKGLVIGFDHIYAGHALPEVPPRTCSAGNKHG